MKHLLDVNVLLAAIWSGHSRNKEVFAWLEGKEIAICPIAALGYLRISTNKKAIGAPMEQARELLERFCKDRAAQFIPDDLPPLDSKPEGSEEVTDHYLADLAAKHHFKLATFDRELKHAAAHVIA